MGNWHEDGNRLLRASPAMSVCQLQYRSSKNDGRRTDQRDIRMILEIVDLTFKTFRVRDIVAVHSSEVRYRG